VGSVERRKRRRTRSVWRKIDKSCVIGARRFLVSIKSGPSTINDTQVQAMTQAVADYYKRWFEETTRYHPSVESLDVVIGLTYCTDRTTNNKDNQILVKLLEHGFVEEDLTTGPGVIIDRSTRRIRVYRRIGKDFWAFVGNPEDPTTASFVFLEILLGLAKALSTGMQSVDLETRINRKIRELSRALARLQFPRNSLPDWIRGDFTEDELFWFASTMTAFYDEGI